MRTYAEQYRMGARNRDRIWIGEYRRAVATVADMAARQWAVIAKCQACGLMTVVDLELVARVSGAATVLWNRKARCKKVGCQGFVEFQAHVPNGPAGYETLTAPPSED